MSKKPKTIRLRSELSDEELDALGRRWRQEREYELSEDDSNIAGIYVDDSFFDILIENEDVNIYKPNGEPLVVFRHNALSTAACKKAYPALREAATEAGNRGIAAGLLKPDEMKIIHRPTVKATKGSKVRMKPIKKDGTLSNTSYAKTVPSGVIGFTDRNSRFPYCRLTAFNMQHADKFNDAMPLIKQVDQVFRKELPDRYNAQLDVINRTNKDFVIPGTAFTTVTVNRNWQTAVHKDAGDLPEGFGVMTVLRAGNYTGCYLVFPKYRVAVNMVTHCVCMADVHEWHGNTPLNGIEGCYERISLVLYYRRNMVHCGSAKEEKERAQKRKRGDKINPEKE